MTKNLKAISTAIAMFAVVGMMTGSGFYAFADPAPEGTQKVYQFNLIAKPNSYEGNCGEGNRIFVDADDRSSKIKVTDDAQPGTWNVVDCNATSDRTAVLNVDVGNYVVYAIAHGKPGTSLSICADYISAYDGDNDLCEVGTFSITREGGKSAMTIMPNTLFDPTLEDIIWDVDATGQAKVQFRVFQVL